MEGHAVVKLMIFNGKTVQQSDRTDPKTLSDAMRMTIKVHPLCAGYPVLLQVLNPLCRPAAQAAE